MPAGYLAAEFLESTGTQYIDTLYTPNNETGMLVNYKANERKDYMVIGVQDVIDGTTCTIYPIRYDATGWNVACWGAQGFYGQGTETRAYHRWESTLNWRNDRLTTITSLDDGHRVQGNLSGLGMPAGTGIIPQYNRSLWFFGRNNQGGFAYVFKGRIYFVKMSQGSDIVHNWIPTLDSQGIPCMFDRVTKQPFYNSGAGQFIVGLTMEQARLLGRLSPTGGELTISLPWEAQLVQHNSEVEAALQAAADKGWTITVQYRNPEADNVYYNKYAACATRADMEAVNPDFANDLTSDGEWVYPLPELRSFSVGYMERVFSQNLTKWRVPLPKLASSIYHMWFNCKKLYHLEIYAPLATSIDNAGRWCPAISYYKLYAPKATYVSAIASYNSVLKEVELDTPNVTNASGYFFYTYALERVNCSADMFHKVTNGNNMYINNSKLLDFPTSYPSLSTADGMFNACEITGQQAIEILTSIPTWADGASHPITMGIHIDYQNDADVLMAITNAETKGWTLTVQWNGTATTQTVSTFGLRSPSIYAKLSTMEYPDGTTKPSLDWGHYVTNWEENGYQEFSSIEEAEEHFNIKQTEEA